MAKCSLKVVVNDDKVLRIYGDSMYYVQRYIFEHFEMSFEQLLETYPSLKEDDKVDIIYRIKRKSGKTYIKLNLRNGLKERVNYDIHM